MARKARTVPLKIIRVSLDPLDPVEAMALRRIEEIGHELRNSVRFEMSQDEVDRYALKRLLFDALVYESNGAKSAFASAGLPPAVVVAAAAISAPAADVPPQQPPQAAVYLATPAALAVSGSPASEVQVQPEPVHESTPASEAQAPVGSWQEQLISESSKPAAPVSSLLKNLSWSGGDD